MPAGDRPSGWLAAVEERRRRKRRRAYAVAALFVAGEAILLGLMAWGWRVLFHDWPSMRLFNGALLGVSAVMWPLAKRLPPIPLPGKDPEETASVTFFKGPRR